MASSSWDDASKIERPFEALRVKVTRLWIEEGCISCNLCEDLAPEVFSVPAGETSRVKPGAEKFFENVFAQIKEAADSCPVEVIKIESSA